MKPLFQTISSIQTKNFFLILTLIISVILLIPTLNFIPILTTGDHGREFYCAQAVIDGKTPYRDFWWVYGPLMPYYFAAFFKMFGIQMSSFLIGKMILTLIGALFFFLTLSIFAPPALAMIGTLWFLIHTKDLFFIYNHIGGVACLLGSLYFVLCYLKDDKIKYLYFSLACLFILGLIKINFALSSLCAFIISVKAIEHFQKYPQKKLNLLIFLGLSIITVIYFLLLKDLPVYEIRQCFPYLSQDQPQQSTPLMTILDALKNTFSVSISNLRHVVFTLLIVISSTVVFVKCLSKNTPSNTKNFILGSLIAVVSFYIFNIHEYILSGTVYRSYWVKPLSILLVFLMIEWATKNLNILFRLSLYGLLLINVYSEATSHQIILKEIKQPENFLSMPRAEIYVGNEVQWIETVQQTTEFLTTHLKRDETFFALPYDCLYYFLAEKNSPTRQLIFFDHINIPEEQEIRIIRELEKNKVNWVVVSSRSISIQGGLGKLGVTYCPLIGKYIANHFEIETEFGPWTSFPGWGADHGTRIMKRKSSIQN